MSRYRFGLWLAACVLLVVAMVSAGPLVGFVLAAPMWLLGVAWTAAVLEGEESS